MEWARKKKRSINTGGTHTRPERSEARGQRKREMEGGQGGVGGTHTRQTREDKKWSLGENKNRAKEQVGGEQSKEQEKD